MPILNAICHAGGCCTMMRININSGEQNGIIESVIESGEFGLRITAQANAIHMASDITTNKVNYCTS